MSNNKTIEKDIESLVDNSKGVFLGVKFVWIDDDSPCGKLVEE